MDKRIMLRTFLFSIKKDWKVSLVSILFLLILHLLLKIVFKTESIVLYVLLGAILFLEIFSLLVSARINKPTIIHLPDGGTDEIYTLSQIKSIEIPLNHIKAFLICSESIKSLEKYIFISESSMDGIIVAQTKNRFFWDRKQIVSIQIREVGATTSEVEITSRPDAIYQFDTEYLNLVNVENIASMILSLATNSKYDPTVCHERAMKAKSRDGVADRLTMMLTILFAAIFVTCLHCKFGEIVENITRLF